MVKLAVIRTETSQSLIAFMCPSSVNKGTFMILKTDRNYTEHCVTVSK